ncbi:MAG: HslU--HslV peptidase ATPase subunit, partial [Methylococcales bacterium]|nr:HslU--HslV peptidase ATPase subunit [Methylococcales bacterium]
MLEKLLEEISFEASDLADKKVVVDAMYVNKYLTELVADEDLSRYIL